MMRSVGSGRPATKLVGRSDRFLSGYRSRPSRETKCAVGNGPKTTVIVWFWQACDEIGWPFGPIFKLLLLTAQRRDEVGGMKWTEIMQNSSQSVLLTEEPSMGATTLGSDYPSP